MKILNVYYGVKAYDFEADPYFYKQTVNPQEGDIEFTLAKAKADLESGNCFWYYIHVMEFSPYTGETSVTSYHDAVPEKQKIILNAAAKAAKKKKTISVADFLHVQWNTQQGNNPEAVVEAIPE